MKASTDKCVHFNRQWFLKAFSSTECKIEYWDREIEVTVPVQLSDEDKVELQRWGIESIDTVTVMLYIDMPSRSPCFYFEETQPAPGYMEQSDQEALKAMEQLVATKDGCGLSEHWYQKTKNERENYLPLTEQQEHDISNYLSKWSFGNLFCKSVTDVLGVLDNLIQTGIAKMDKGSPESVLLGDTMAAYIEVRDDIIRGGLPTIHEVNMYYEVAVSRMAVSVHLVQYNYDHRLTHSLNQILEGKNAPSAPLLPTVTTIYEKKFRLLTCNMFAKRCGVEPVTIRQWIRRGKLRSAVRVGRDWMIPATTTAPQEGFTSATYYIVGQPSAEATTEYPFLKNLYSQNYIRLEEAPGAKYTISKAHSFSGDDGKLVATLDKKDREKFELTLLQSDWAEYYTPSHIIAAKLSLVNEVYSV